MYYPAAAGTLLTLLALSAFRWLENRLPSHQFAQHRVRFAREEVMAEDALRELLGPHGFTVSGLTYRLTDHGEMFEYRMMIRTTDEGNFTRLARALAALPKVREFDLSPSAD